MSDNAVKGGTGNIGSNGPDGGGGIIQKILSLFMGSGDPEREKKKILKDIAKSLKKQKYKFYKPKGKEAQLGLARFFYDIYHALGPAQVILENAENSAALKTITIERYMSKDQKRIIEHLSEESIRERVAKQGVKKVAEELKQELVQFFSGFDSEKVKEINALYNLFLIFSQILRFDYYFLLKKFDSNLPERNFSYTPKFESINGEYIVDDLKDFMEIMPLLEENAQWDNLMDTLKEYRGQEVVNRQEWKKALKVIVDVRKSGVLGLIVKHIEEDPYYKSQFYAPREKIVEGFLQKIKTQAEMTIQKIINENRNDKIEKLATLVFGTSAVSRMKNYTEKANMAFSKKMLGGYVYVVPANYLKAFLLDYFKRDIKEVVDVLLIKAEWSTHVMSQKLSEAFHSLMQLSDELLKLDDEVAEDAEIGQKFKALLPKIERDQNAMGIIKQLLKEINDKMGRIIKESAQNLIALGKNLKVALEDHKKHPHELIINWKELEAEFEEDIEERIANVYKKIYYFVQLMQFYFK